MKTTGQGIDDSRDVENVYHLRLMTILQELLRDKGHKGAARVLDIDQQTLTESARTGVLTRRVRQALERALQEGIGSAAARQRERNDKLEQRVQHLEEGHDALGREVRRRLSALEGRVGALRREEFAHDGQSREGPFHSDATPPKPGTPGGAATTLPAKPSTRREYPDLATRGTADDDEEVFGDAWPLIVEWRELKDAHPNEGRGLEWLKDERRLLEVELALLEEHRLTLPPEQRPLRGFARSGQVNWRWKALQDARRALSRRELILRVRGLVTFGLWIRLWWKLRERISRYVSGREL